MKNSYGSMATAAWTPTAFWEFCYLRRARHKLVLFTTFTYPPYVVEPAHALIARTLDRVVAGDIMRLMIFAPPQHGKSELVSVRLPAFWLGKRPNDPIILASYAASLAESKSRQARRIVESTEYGLLFPEIQTRADSRAVDHWELRGHKGGLLAAGVGGPITGHGAKLGLIDDPVENWEQAQSPAVRDKTWEWWRTTFRTRVWEGGAIVLIMTRWHEDDLAGRILAEQAADWTVLRLPALAETQDERDRNQLLLGGPVGRASSPSDPLPDPLGRSPGEPLCPRRFGLPALEALRRDVGALAWAGQYQGTPRAPEGNRFKRSWFGLVDAPAPADARRLRYWDRAATPDGGDYTAGILLARANDGLYFIEDVVRGQWSSGQRDQIMRATAERDAAAHANSVHVWIEQEGGSGGKESAQAALRLLAGFPVFTETVTGSKEVRAEPFAAQAEAGCIRIVRAPWNAAFLDELCAFPHGAHDDMVDATSGAFNKLARQAAYVPGIHVIQLPRRSLYDRMREPSRRRPGLFGVW